MSDLKQRLYYNVLEEEPPVDDLIQAAEDEAQQRTLSAEDLGWVDYNLHDEQEGMAFQQFQRGQDWHPQE